MGRGHTTFSPSTLLRGPVRSGYKTLQGKRNVEDASVQQFHRPLHSPNTKYTSYSLSTLNVTCSAQGMVHRERLDRSRSLESPARPRYSSSLVNFSCFSSLLLVWNHCHRLDSSISTPITRFGDTVRSTQRCWLTNFYQLPQW